VTDPDRIVVTGPLAVYVCEFQTAAVRLGFVQSSVASQLQGIEPHLVKNCAASDCRGDHLDHLGVLAVDDRAHCLRRHVKTCQPFHRPAGMLANPSR
jgi:hypothetical protein